MISIKLLNQIVILFFSASNEASYNPLWTAQNAKRKINNNNVIKHYANSITVISGNIPTLPG